MNTPHASAGRVAIAIGTALLATTVGLVACNGDDDDDGSPGTTTGTSVATTLPATTTPSTSATTASTPSTAERANYGPSSVSTYAQSLGLVLDTASGRCNDLFAMPREALLYISPEARREVPTADLWTNVAAALNGVGVEVDPQENQLVESDAGSYEESLAEPVFRVFLGNNLPAAAIGQVNEVLAGNLGRDDVTIDLNHVGPFLPAPTFHPADDPLPATDIIESSEAHEVQGGEHRVLVVDSPELDSYDEWNEAWTGAPSDNTPDGMVDFVAGHGTFIVDLIDRLAPGADVKLEGVVHTPAGPAASIALPGFLFTEVDVVRAIERALGAEVDGPESGELLPVRRYREAPFDVINLSLGTVGCPDATHDVLARALNDVLTLPYAGVDGAGSATMFVAAAGNDGLETPPGTPFHAHYPAGYAVVTPGLGEHIVAVGAHDDDGVAADYSNTCVVNAWAPGTATAVFPWLGTPPPALATWAGTSFATAYVTAALADDPGPVMTTWQDAVANGHFADDAIQTQPVAAC